MPVLYEKANPSLYSSIEHSNLRTQWNTLDTILEYALNKDGFKFTPDLLFALHSSASLFLDQSPGQVRLGHCHIRNSKHVPPDPSKINSLLDEMFQYLNSTNSDVGDYHAAAFCLWRITWIHPFNECNGRTARAFCFLVLCTKFGVRLPGNEAVHSLIRKKSDDYYQGLEMADAHYARTGKFDVYELEKYLREVTYMQILSRSSQL